MDLALERPEDSAEPALDYQRRALAMAAICAAALEKDLRRTAMLGARGAARSALLAFGAMPHRPPSLDLHLLRCAASARDWRDAGLEMDQTQLAREVMATVERLLGGPGRSLH